MEKVNIILFGFLEELKLGQLEYYEKRHFETYVMFCNIYLNSCDFSEEEGRWPIKHVKILLNSSDYIV